MLLVSLLLSVAIFFTACEKENDSGTSQLNVRMTDNPAVYAKVNVDIKEVRVKFDDDSTDNDWQLLNTKAGVYNLLDFQNGKDTLIASGTITAKTVKQIRLILGVNNSVEVGGVNYPLTVPSGAESGLKIKLNKSVNMPQETVVIDFDALLSIRQENGSYKLRPVIVVKGD